MPTSFAAYASQFLNRQQNNAEDSLASSQPLFFSFTTDNGSRGGNNADSDLDDLDDPHLRGSSARDHSGYHVDDDDEDPYLRLDEEDHPGRSRYDSQSIPLISSDLEPGPSQLPESPKGWLAHQVSPLRRSPSPSSSSSDLGPPPDIFQPTRHAPTPPPPPPRQVQGPVSLSLTESLLPRDGTMRPIDVFSLPDPRHVPRGRRKYNDSIWTALWCSGLTLCILSSMIILFLTRKPSNHPRVPLPYTTLLHTVPLLTILTFLSALAAYAHIFLLRIFVRPVMVATSVFIPATLFISSVWAFIGSFMWEAGQEPTWGETVGLRLFALIPLVLSLFTARRLLNLPREIHTTSSTLTLTTQLLIANPFLLALSPVILLIALVASIPFLTLVFRLLLIGYFSRPDGTTWEWHVKGWADWAIVGTVGVWLWSWGVARGILRMTCGSVIGAWYFADPVLPHPPPTSTHTIHAALTRSTGPSLGTIILASLLLTAIRLLVLLTGLLRLLPSYLPLILRPGIAMAVGMLDSAGSSLSGYALVYGGLTGDGFWTSARRARALTAAVEGRRDGKYKRKFKTEPPLTLLTVAPLTLTFPFALTTYLFVAHTLNVPDQALGASLLAGGVTALVGLFCVGLVKDAADTLYICYCIDKDIGERRRDEVFAAFEYDNQPRATSRQSRRPPSTPLQQQRQASLSSSPPTRESHQEQQQTPRAEHPRRTPFTDQEQEYQQQQRLPLPVPQTSNADAEPPDPFEHDSYLAQSHSVVENNDNTAKGYLDEDSGDEDGGGDSQFFPGSGLFGSK